MDGRETQTKKTKGGHDVIMKTYLTQREMRPAILSGEGKENNMKSNFESTDEMVKAAIVSIDGKPEVLDAFLDLPASDSLEVTEWVTDLFSAIADQKKTMNGEQ